MIGVTDAKVLETTLILTEYALHTHNGFFNAFNLNKMVYQLQNRF